MICSEPALMDSEPLHVQRQSAQPQNREQGTSFVIPSMMTVSPPNAHPQHARLRKPRRGTRSCSGQVVDAEVRSGQDQSGASETVGTTSYPLIGLYDEDHRARALASGQHLTELNPHTHEPLRFDKRYERYLRPAGLMGLANICRAGLPSIDRALVSALVDRWRPETHTFHMPCGEVTITLQDVAMILGLPIADRAVTVNQAESQNELVKRYLGKAPPSDRPRPGLRVSWVRAGFNNCPEDADEETVKQHARACILSLIGGLLFPDASGDMCCRGRVHNDWAQKHKSFVDMWEAKEQHVIMEERPYDHANYMDYLRWCRRSTRIRFFTPRRISNGHKGGASGGNAIADSEDPFHASQLRTFGIPPGLI